MSYQKQLLRLYFFLLFVFNYQNVFPQVVHEFIDLQIHTTMHVAHPVLFSKGLVYFNENKPPRLSYKHLLTNVNYANYFKNNKGCRIIVNGALPTEHFTSKKKAKKLILKQINYINQFAKNNSEDFVVAKTPQEVRYYINNTNKTVIIHSIEGGNKLIDNIDDAKFWTNEGVSFVTLIHLTDGVYGSAAVLPSLPTRLLNLKGYFRKEKNRRLTEKGKQAILWLAQAGVMTDITHMADQTRTDALEFMKQKHIPPISTHDGFKPIQNRVRAISEKDILEIYANNGFVSLPISGITLMPYKPEKRHRDEINTIPNYCNGSIDSYKYTYLKLKEFIENNVKLLGRDSVTSFQNLTEAQKVHFAIGFQTDFNGWLNHSKPRYGKHGCQKTPINNNNIEEVELKGLAHPGLMESHWKTLEKEGVDLEPIKRSSEKFLQVWQYFLDHKSEFK